MSVSRTSQAVAVTRAGFARPHSSDGDPEAQRRLCAGMRSVMLDGMRASLAARTRFFDDQVVTAIMSGVRQVVILGAGYDDRALRFRTPGVTFYELDHPATQADKQARLTAIDAEDRTSQARDGTTSRWRRSPVLAAADFTREDVAAVLAAAGHDPAEPTLFLCEGLLVYLDQPSTMRFLELVRAAAGTGSTLAASLATHAPGLDSSFVLERANAARRTAESEPWLTILPASEQDRLLAQAGWQVVSAVDAAQLGTGADPGRSLLVTAKPAR